MAIFFYNTISTAKCFFLGLAINYYLSIHIFNLGKPHIEQSPLIDNVNYTTAFSPEIFSLLLGWLAHENVQKKFFWAN